MCLNVPETGTGSLAACSAGDPPPSASLPLSLYGEPCADCPSCGRPTSPLSRVVPLAGRHRALASCLPAWMGRGPAPVWRAPHHGWQTAAPVPLHPLPSQGGGGPSQDPLVSGQDSGSCSRGLGACVCFPLTDAGVLMGGGGDLCPRHYTLPASVCSSVTQGWGH